MASYSLPSSYYKEKTRSLVNAVNGCRNSQQLYSHVIGSSHHQPINGNSNKVSNGPPIRFNGIDVPF